MQYIITHKSDPKNGPCSHTVIRHITNMFKNTNIGIALRSTNNIHNLLKITKTTQQINKQKVGYIN
jgi:hypothetical protein